ncbi:MAG: HAD family hydrolase [Oscillospiraceae bacterium]|jgi:putative hydrolase of the HAD superfamily|nr:HAD family hydrolase [Oscillospiraceae bacterium]
MNRAVFWDFDGTLARSESLWTGTMHRTLARFGIDADYETVYAHMHTGFPWHATEDAWTDAVGYKWWERLFAHFDALYRKLNISADTMEINRAVREIVLSTDSYIVYDDAASALQRCAEAGYENYILSNNYPEMEDVIKALGLHGYFKKFAVSGQVGYDKPRRELFEYALNLAGNPQTRYMVGDNPVADIRGGKNAGMTTILVHNDTPCDADFVCGSLNEVAEILCGGGEK